MQKPRGTSLLVLLSWGLSLGLLLAGPRALQQPQPAPSEEILYRGKSLGYWIGLLKRGDPLDAEEAIVVLAEIGPDAKAALPALAPLLTGEDRTLRFQAAIAVWNIGRQGKEALPALVEVLKDPSSGSRWLAMKTVGEMGPEAAEIAPQLVAALTDKNTRLHQAAADALEQMGAAAAPALTAGLDQPDAVLRRTCAFVLQWLPPAAASVARAKLTAALNDKDGQLRLDAATALWRLDHATELIGPVLAQLIVDPNKVFHKKAAELLCHIKPRPKSAIKGFQALLRDPDLSLRVQAAWALWDIHHNPGEVLPTLLAVLKDPKGAQARVRAGEVLAFLGPAAKPALPLIIADAKIHRTTDILPLVDVIQAVGTEAMPAVFELLHDQSPGSKVWTRSLMAALGPEAVKPLLELMDDPGIEVRIKVMESLGFVVPLAKDAVPALIEAVKTDKVEKVRAAALLGLAQIGPSAQDAAPLMLAVLKDKQSPSRLTAIMALDHIRVDARTALPTLEEITKDGDANVRIEAIDLRWRLDSDAKKAALALAALVKQKGVRLLALDLLSKRTGLLDVSDPAMVPIYQNAVPGMADALKDPSPNCRRLAAVCLGRLGALAQPALPGLMAALGDNDGEVPFAVAEAVREIGGDCQAAGEGLLPDLKSADFAKSLRAHRLIRKLGAQGKEVVALVMEQLKDNVPDRRTNAAETLCALVPAQRELAMHVLLQGLSSGPGGRIRAAMGLCRVDGVKERYVDSVLVSLTVPDGEVRFAAILALAEIGQAFKEKTKKALEFLLEDEGLLTRVVASWALWRVDPGPLGIECLVANLQDRTIGKIRGQAALYLREIGPPAKDAVPALIAALKDRQPAVRAIAADALVKIDPQAAAKAGYPW